MSISKKIIVIALLSLLGEPLVSAADQTTANVPVDSVYYQYLDKLSGMGYVKSLRMGRSRIAGCSWRAGCWRRRRQRRSGRWRLPGGDQMAALEVYVASEVEALSGGKLVVQLQMWWNGGVSPRGCVFVCVPA